MTIDELIKELQEKRKEIGGDIQCVAWQHPEEEPPIQDINTLNYEKKENQLFIF